MSDVTEAEIGAQAANAGDGGKRKRLLLIGGAAGAALLIVAGAGGWFLLQSGSGSDAGVSGEIAAASEAYFYDLPEMTVNLNTGGGQPGYLRMKVSLELRDESVVSLVEPQMPRVLDAFQVYLRELRRSDLEGSAGIYRLKEELQRRINLAVYPASVDNILFKEILIQ